MPAATNASTLTASSGVSLSSAQSSDVVVIGAGAAGMLCAATAAAAGRRVVLIDHATKLAEKIRISGGGRCNFTNVEVTPANFISANPHFCRTALAGYTPQDFMDLLRSYGITWHEKHRGQLFCDESSEQIISMLRQECERAQVQWRMPCTVQKISKTTNGFDLETTAGRLRCAQLVIATGGTAVPQVGATDFGLRLARQFDLKIIEPRAALVPLQFDPQVWSDFGHLAGLSVQAEISVANGPKQSFLEDMLFTHRGLSGPGILQISSYWRAGQALAINLLPQSHLAEQLIAQKSGTRQQMSTVLGQFWPKRLAEQWLGDQGQRKLAEWSDRAIRTLVGQIQDWRLMPSGSAGLRKAEVMAGGVDTDALDQRSMQVKGVEGLFFIGEVVDVTGWLGGYNFQWAWASAVACGRALASATR
jgi:predicted Rossmann fold flavoprotein